MAFAGFLQHRQKSARVEIHAAPANAEGLVPLLAGVGDHAATTTDAGNNVHIHWHGDWLTLGLLLLASSVTTWLYSSILQSSSRQATVGQRALGLVITDLDGNRISFARASGRYLATLLTGLTFGIGYLMMIWTKRKQTLQDKIAGTVVIPKRH